MYRCCDCGHMFDSDDAATHKEWHTIDGRDFAELWAACPECGSTDLEDAVACPICGGYSARGLCVDCRKGVNDELNEIVEKADNNDGKEAVLDVIQDFVEGYGL